ncbi:MAG: DivIVA domain-containing protein [Thermoleophilia bacterium]|nr:DivIVA domain-containing protein [Thermoleophilia bacterium]
MKLTPLDIRHKEFKRGMRGYADEEVDEFLDQIADEFERLFKDNIDLGERVENLEEQVTRYRRIEETLQKTLVSAQQSAEELKQNATKEGQLILRDAELKARQMVNESYADKQRIEGSLTKLRGVEEEFRIRFRQLLEGFLKQVEQAPPVAPPPQNDLNRKAEAIKEAIAREETVMAPAPPAQGAAPARAAAPAPAAPAPPGRAPEPRPAEPPQPRPDPATRKVPRFGPGSGDLEAMTSVVPQTGPGASQPGAGGAEPQTAPSSSPAPGKGSPGGAPVAGARPDDRDLVVDVDAGVSDDEFKW